MAEKETLVVTIAPDGQIKMEYKGKTGSECVQTTQEIEAAIGKVENREKTADYYKPDPDRPVFEKW